MKIIKKKSELGGAIMMIDGRTDTHPPARPTLCKANYKHIKIKNSQRQLENAS
jgi:hypothetical protein